MESTPGDLLLALSRFSGKAIKRMDANLSVHGISFSEYQVLHHLSRSPKRTLPRIELARSVGLTASGVTRMIAPMEKIGLVEKESHPRDARMSMVKLSASGSTVYTDATETVNQVAAGFLGDLTKSQQEALSRLLPHDGVRYP